MTPGIYRTPGIYALASLEGAPLDPADLQVLGIEREALPESALRTPGIAPAPPGIALRTPGIALRAYDPQPEAVSTERGEDCLTVFAGYLDEPEQLAAQLGCDAGTSTLTLAVRALERFGADAAYHALGTWTLLRWHLRRRELTVLSSQMLRDNLYVAMGRGLIAIAPRCLMLGDLSWVGRALDPHTFALNVSRAGLRHIRTDETIWRGIKLLPAGTCSLFTSAGRKITQMAMPSTWPRFEGSFEEAVGQFDRVGRRIIRQHLERQQVCAFQLSGGLDSTLLTTWGALERGPGREMFAVTSVAPPGSGLVDEQEFSEPAARMLDVPLHKAWPSSDESLFRPEASRFARVEGLVSGAYLTVEALEACVLAGGATASLSGHAGEMHVSNGFDLPETRGALRLWGARLRDRVIARRQRGGWPAGAFHPMLSPALLHSLPAEWAGIWRKGPPGWWDFEPGGTLGISPGAAKNVNFGSGHPEGLLRMLGPYFDQRLQRLAAGMPVSFLMHRGQTRPFARALLKSRVPDEVCLRRQSRPFSPDFVPRLRAQAGLAQMRLPVFAEAGLDRWIDLARLAQGLKRMKQSTGPADYSLCHQVQGTAVVAEFLLWASSERISV